MRVCFVVNNVRTQRPTYTTLYLAFAAAARGHDVAFVSVDALTQGEDGRVFGSVVRPRPGRLRTAALFAKALTAEDAPREDARVDEFDVVFLRNNPNVGGAVGGAAFGGFNPAIEFGRRLKQTGVTVVNDPDGLLRAGSKMYLASLPASIRPKTLITRSEERVRGFLRDLDGPAIIKPLFGFGGRSVFYLRRGQAANLAQIISAVKSHGYLIVQEYLAAVTKGDKRVLLLGGVPIQVDGHFAAYRRMRPKDDIRNNMHVGGARKPGSLNAAERRLCDLMKPRLLADGLYFVGVDLVGEKVLEINVFAPGGIYNINQLYDIDVAGVVIRNLERKVALKAGYRPLGAAGAAAT